jgi:diguanylate cyclase (GGDEF)-like protein
MNPLNDPLTNIPNRRCLLQVLERELLHVGLYLRPLALVLFDIDHFKAVNDRFGHLGGDFTLHELAISIGGMIPQKGLFARYGGEEFAVVLPEADLEIGLNVAERLRAQVANQTFHYDGTSFSMTVSLGVTTTAGNQFFTADEFLYRADANLYQAKRTGRNRVVGD